MPVPEQESFIEPDYFSGQASDESEFGEVSFADIDTSIAPVDNSQDVDSGTISGGFENMEEEFEIEVDFEDEADLEIPLKDTVTEPAGDGWLETVGKMLDTLATKGGKVKFASSVEGSDAQSHYDLGLAFMEMGLYDESFTEFRMASADTGRRFACFMFQGVCLREKGDLANAEKVLRSLVNPGLSLEDLCTVKYELALICEACGKFEEYISLLAEIDASHRHFRDVHSRLAASNNDKDFLDFTDDDLKGLDFK